MKEYIDKTKRSYNDFYDIQDSITEDNIPESMAKLEAIIKKDKTHFDACLLLADLYECIGEDKEANIIISDAYNKALELITDKKGNWPDKLEWGWMENRPIIRTFINMGMKYWKENKNIEAYALFQKLLETNPNDNAGIRYFMLAILEKMSEKQFNKRFDKGGYWDNEISDWFNKKVGIHKEKFGSLLEMFGGEL